jgi:hypothetical protein
MSTLDYTSYVAALANLLEIPSADTDFSAILPRCIDYAEQRLYRELQLLSNSSRNSSFSLTAGSRNLAITTGTFVVISNINVIVPAGTTNPDNGSRVSLTPASWDFMDAVYGSSSAGVPKYFAVQDTATVAVGPWPDQSYRVEIIGTVRPPQISASNTTTTLSLYFPELLVAASMVFLSGYTRDFGQQSDDPQMSVSWEKTYQSLMVSAVAEEQLKRSVSNPVVKSS